MPVGIEFVDAAVVDARAASELILASKRGSFDVLEPRDSDVEHAVQSWERYLGTGSTAQAATGDGFGVFALLAGRRVGFAAYHHTRRYDCDAELQKIYVLKTAQGRGVGTAMLRLIADRLVADGSKTMCVGYDPANPYKRFYAKHGTVEINPHWSGVT